MKTAIVRVRPAAIALLLATAACIAIPLHPKTGRRPLPQWFLDRYDFEWVEVPVDEETTLRGVWLDRRGPPVLVFYGAGMSIQRTAELLEILYQAGYSSLCCDYRGVGYSSGEKGKSRFIDDDARALWEWLRREKGEPAGVIGISLGSVAAAPLAHHPHPPAALVLDRPVNPRNVIYRWTKAHLGTVSSWIAHLLVRTSTDVDVRADLERARTDVLVVLPEHDILMPPDDAAELLRGLPERVRAVTVPGGHVSSQLVEPSRWRGAILDFLDARLHPPEPGGGRTMAPGPARVVAWRREGRRLQVTLDRDDFPDGLKLLHFGLKRNAAVWIEHPTRELTIELPRKHRHRTFGVRVVPADYENPVGTKWITESRPPDRSK